MRSVLQRVTQADVTVAGESVGKIGKGVLVLLGVEKGDTGAEVVAMARKLQDLRLFSDDQGRMNLAARDAGGAFLVVSQFTLAADLAKGNRPSFDNAAPPEAAEALYEQFVFELKKGTCPVATGKFRAMMEVSLVNDGPVTFIL